MKMQEVPHVMKTAVPLPSASHPGDRVGGSVAPAACSSSALPSAIDEIAIAWWDMLKDGELVTNGAASLWRAGAGLFLAIVVGAGLGIFMAWWRPVNVVLGPLVEALIRCRNRR